MNERNQQPIQGTYVKGLSKGNRRVYKLKLEQKDVKFLLITIGSLYAREDISLETEAMLETILDKLVDLIAEDEWEPEKI